MYKTLLLSALPLALAMLTTHRTVADTPSSFPVTISVDATKTVGPMKPIWRFFGADEPNYATAPNGEKLIADQGKLRPDEVYFRTHNLMTTGDGTPALKWGSTNLYTEDAHGKPVYNWTIVDHIFDTYRKHGVRPYVQLGFMPEALSTHPVPYQHHWTPTARYDEIYTGWAYPPKDYDKWGELVYQWAHHCIERYGRAEVETWYWETWNEPNIGYWRGTSEEFYHLHDVTVAAVRRALPTARVGGPDAAGGGSPWLHSFLEHCVHGTNHVTGTAGTPTDFLSFHAKGAPTFTASHVRMGIANELRDIDRGFGMVASFPELKDKPIVIGECDPDGCAACQGPQLGYRNGTLYSSYTAASFARIYELADRHGVNIEGALTWAFEFENQPLFAGFRALSSEGINLPVFNVFRMFSKMSGDRVATTSTVGVDLDAMMAGGVRGATSDVSALATRDAHRLSVLAWHYHDDDIAGPDADVTVNLTGLPSGVHAHLTQYRIDEDHGNAFATWKRMGSPADLTPSQRKELEKASQLDAIGKPTDLTIDASGAASVRLTLPRQAVALLQVDWK